VIFSVIGGAVSGVPEGVACILNGIGVDVNVTRVMEHWALVVVRRRQLDFSEHGTERRATQRSGAQTELYQPDSLKKSWSFNEMTRRALSGA
jgi:hypothetical protein